jgi:sucrose-6-phosphate hydrolase SacC (GH32 family)
MGGSSVTSRDEIADPIAITWMQNWNKPKEYLGNDYFSGVMTIPRRMTLSSSNIIKQHPVQQIESLRVTKVLDEQIISQKPITHMIPETSDVIISIGSLDSLGIRFTIPNSVT